MELFRKADEISTVKLALQPISEFTHGYVKNDVIFLLLLRRVYFQENITKKNIFQIFLVFVYI